ncbi:MAG: peptide deformylase [Rickettsiales bacterium]|jgi:peptide deformylase|nr:peptide deformylase [Rickettsiales bacterium]
MKAIICFGVIAVGAVCSYIHYGTRRRVIDLKSKWVAPGAEGELRLRNIAYDMDVLRTRCTPVDRIDSRVLKNLDGMLEIMYKNRGIGLGANQAGLVQRLVVVDLQENGVKKPIFMINPEILEKSEVTRLGPEGCLSLPLKEKSEVRRSTKIKVRYLNKAGEEIVLEATGLLAICIQHEVDLLDGILYIDHLPKERRDFVVERVKENIKRLEKGKDWR